MKETFTLVATAAAGLEAVVGVNYASWGTRPRLKMVRCVFKVMFVQLLKLTFG